MVKYLSMDGVDDYISIPFPVGTRYIKLRMKKNDTQGYLFDMRTAVSAYLLHSAYTGYNSFKLDGVSQSVGTANFTSIPSDRVAEVLIGLNNATTVSGTMTFARRSSATTSAVDHLVSEFYEIVLYDTSMNVIQAFDWTTGSGQTLYSTTGAGNGTITGGTWLDDGTGGGTTPTVHEGESILSSASNLTVESNLIYNGESTISAISDLIAEASVIQSAEAILSAISTLTAEGDKISPEVSVDLSASSSLSAIGSVIVNGETVLSSNSDLTAIGEIISMDISVELSTRSSLTVEGAVIQSGEASFSAVSQLEALANLIISGEVELSATSQLTVLPEKDLVGVIRLKGKRELYVYLKGKRELEVHLKGGLNVTEYNQNFTMEAGDSKILSYEVSDDLSSATLTWEMHQRGQTIPLISKTGSYVNGSVQVELLPSDTQAINGTYKYELQCVDVLSKKSTLAKGVITLE